MNAAKKDWVTTQKERISYNIYFTGQNAIYNLVALFLTTYLMFQGINPAKSATVMLLVKIWDAFNDAIFGCIFDKIKFRNKQKFLPWLKISLALIPIATILLFSIPKGATEAVQLTWFAIAYMFWDTAYTLCDVPIFGIITSMTPRLDERESMLSYKSILAACGTGITYIICTLFVSEQVGLNFSVAAIIISVFAFVVMLPMCAFGKERVTAPSDTEFTIKRMLQYIVKNKYLLIFYIGFFFYSAFSAGGPLNLLVSFFIFNNSLFSLILMALAVAPMLVMALIVPKLLQKIDKMKLYRICIICSIVINLTIFIVGYSNIYIYLALAVINSIPLSVTSILMFMFTPDCAEYGKFKSGIEARGITFAIQTFMAKLTAAVSGSLGLFLLALFGWQTVKADSFQDLANLAAAGFVQTASALNGLWFIYTLLPSIGALIAFLIWGRYKLNDEDVQTMTDCNFGKITREEAEAKLTKKL